MIVFSPSLLDWPRLELCVPAGHGRRCVHESNLRLGVPDADLGPGPMVLRVPLRASPAPDAGPTRHFHAPGPGNLRRPNPLVPGPGSRVAPDGRHATLASGDSGALEIAWELFSPGCPAYLSHVELPFFLETANVDAAELETVLRRRER